MSKYYLVGDVGATKTNLAVCADGNAKKYSAKEKFLTSDFASLENLIGHFLKRENVAIERAVLAVAGPVLNNKVTISSSNLPWEIDKSLLIQALNIPDLLLINDLEALAQSIPLLGKDDLHCLNRGVKKDNASVAVIAPGTGLGQGYLIWDGKKYRSCISEGAHVNFGPRTELEIGLLQYMRGIHKHVSYESVCSGMGIPSIYEYLKTGAGFEEPAWFSDLIGNANDKTPLIIEAAMNQDRPCEIARKTIDQFVSILGSETGNLVLKTMATGGVFLGGGIPPRIIPILDSPVFFEPYKDKGLMAEMMLQIPIHVILNSDANLFGCADYLFNDGSQGAWNEQ